MDFETYRSLSSVDLEQLVCQNPGDVQMLFLLGQKYGDERKLQQAEVTFRCVLELRPAHVEAWGFLGDACYDQRRWAQAITAWEKYRTLLGLPCSWGILDWRREACLGHCYRHMGRLAEAVECYRRAIKGDPTESESHLGLTAIAYSHPGVLPLPKSWAKPFVDETVETNRLDGMMVSFRVQLFHSLNGDGKVIAISTNNPEGQSRLGLNTEIAATAVCRRFRLAPENLEFYVLSLQELLGPRAAMYRIEFPSFDPVSGFANGKFRRQNFRDVEVRTGYRLDWQDVKF